MIVFVYNLFCYFHFPHVINKSSEPTYIYNLNKENSAFSCFKNALLSDFCKRRRLSIRLYFFYVCYLRTFDWMNRILCFFYWMLVLFNLKGLHFKGSLVKAWLGSDYEIQPNSNLRSQFFLLKIIIILREIYMGVIFFSW